MGDLRSSTAALQELAARQRKAGRETLQHEERLDTLTKRMSEQFGQLSSQIQAVDGKVDDLQDEMRERFEAVDQQFKAVDRRFDELQGEMNERFEAVDRRFVAVDERFKAVDRRFDELQGQLGTVTDHLKVIAEAVGAPIDPGRPT